MMRLLCLPFAGGSSFAFNGWARALAPAVEVNAIELPGRGRRLKEKALDRMDAIVDEVLAVLVPTADEPFSLYGHSMGALVALEVARELRRRRLPPPSRLLVAALRAPYRGWEGTRARSLVDRSWLDRTAVGSGPGVDDSEAELRELLRPALEADLAAIETFVYTEEDPLVTPITVFVGSKDPHVDAVAVEGWQALTIHPLDVRTIPGGHLFVVESPAEVVAAVRAALAATEAPGRRASPQAPG